MHQLVVLVLTASTLCCVVTGFSNVCTMDSQCYPNSCCASKGCTTTPPFCPAGLACAAPCVGLVPGCFEHTCGCNATSGSCVVKKIQPPSTTVQTTTPAVVPPTPVQTTTASTQAPNSNVCTMDSQCYPNSCCASTGCSTTPPFCPAGLACAAPCVGPVPGCFEHTCGCNATSGSCVVKKIQPPSPLLSTSSPVVTSMQTTIPPVTSVQSAVATPWPLLLAAGGAGFLVALVGVTCGVCLLRKSRRDVAAAAVAKKSAEVHLNDDHNDVCVAL